MIETILKYYKPPFKVDDLGYIFDSIGKNVATTFARDLRLGDDETEAEYAFAKELCYLLNLAAANQISDNGMAESQ